jgi:hypothetical protein
MIEQIEGLPPGTLGFRASGQVTAADYERVLYHLGPDFTGFDPGAMWDDAMLGFRHFSGWDRVALVTDVQWLRIAATAMDFAVPAEFHVFRNAELVKAIDWIREPREEPEDGNK